MRSGLGHTPASPTPHSVQIACQQFGSAPLPASVREFETRWDEEAWVREIRNDWKQPSRGPLKPGAEIFVASAQSRRDLIHRRLAVGFEHFGGIVAGRHHAPFTERGVRSEASHVLRRIVHATPRTSRMRVGRDKGAVWTTDSKLLGLDEPYIHLNAEVRSVFRIDLDHSFPSWGALRQEVADLALPCLPSVAVAFEDETRRIERPHLLWLLPYNGGVWFSDDPSCRRDIMSLWRGVHAGITKTLMPLGADPGALSNPDKIKCPLSPFWSVQVWNETAFPSLSEWAGWVDTSTSRDRMIRDSAAALSGMERTASNALFAAAQELSFGTLREWHHAADADYAGAILRRDRDALAERLFRALVGRVSAAASNPKQGQAVLYRVATYAADHWDPSRAGRDGSRDRGACADAVEDVQGVAARQAVGARYAAGLRRSRSADAIREAIEAARAAGDAITVSGIARRSGMDRKTVRANWPDEESAA